MSALGLVRLAATAPASASVFGCIGHPIGCVKGAVGGVVGGLASDAVTSLAQEVMKAVVWLLQHMSTLWVGITPPQMTDASGQPTGTVAWLSQHLTLLTVALATVSILVGAFKIAVEEAQGGHVRQLVKFLVTFTLVSACAAVFADTLIYAFDQMATWMISNAIGQETFAGKLGKVLGVALQGAPPAGFAATLAVAFGTIVLGILACLAMMAQVAIMLLRGGMLIALVGTLPAAAAGSNTEMGMQWFKRQVAWVIAWAAYPLAAAIIYSAAFLLPGQGGIDALLSGVLLLIAAVVALPVLIRFLVPMTAAVSGGGGVGQIAAEGAAAAMLMRGLPSGAADVNDDAHVATENGGATADGGPGGDGSSSGDGGAPSGATAVDGSGDTPGAGTESTDEAGSAGAAGMGAAQNGSGAGAAPGGGAGGASGAAGGEGAAAGGGGAAGGAGAGAAAGAAAVRMGMDVTRQVGETAVDGADGNADGGGSPGGPTGAAGGHGANGSSGSEGAMGEAASPPGAAAARADRAGEGAGEGGGDGGGLPGGADGGAGPAGPAGAA